jgi:hypothetical protein
LKRLFALSIVLAPFFAGPASASATTLGFSCFSNNNAADCDILEAQMSVELTQTGNWLNFIFSNTGPDASFIDGVYFSDPSPSLLAGAPAFEYYGKVKFSATCSPGDLPNNWGTTYCADADSPAPKNGVNPDEWLKISYQLQVPNSLATILAGIEAGTFDIGIKVQGFASGGSEWATVREVPEPGSLVMFGTALAALLPRLRRRRPE